MADEFVETEFQIDEPAAAAAAVQREKEVKTLLGSNPEAALLKALENPPLGSTKAETLATSSRAVVAALVALKEKDTETAITKLSPAQQTLLMKYIYRGLSLNDNSTQLLKIHEKLVEKAGLGCITRALSDPLTV